MDEVIQFFQPVLDFFQAGFAQVNAIQGIIIAVISAFVLREYKRIFVIAAVATIVHVIVDVVVPVIRGAQLALPPVVEPSWWKYVATLYVGYLIVITIFYILKRLLIRG